MMNVHIHSLSDHKPNFFQAKEKRVGMKETRHGGCCHQKKKEWENSPDFNIGNKYFVTSMRSSNDSQVRKGVKKSTLGRKGIPVGLKTMLCRSIGYASNGCYKPEGEGIIFMQARSTPNFFFFPLQFHAFF